jgi:hypothetical protein
MHILNITPVHRHLLSESINVYLHNSWLFISEELSNVFPTLLHLLQQVTLPIEPKQDQRIGCMPKMISVEVQK